MTIDQKIRLLCERRGWTLSNLVAQIRQQTGHPVALTTVSAWWRGKHGLDTPSVLRLARTLDVPVDYLIDDAVDEPLARLDVRDDELAIVDLLRALGLGRATAMKRLLRPHPDEEPA